MSTDDASSRGKAAGSAPADAREAEEAARRAAEAAGVPLAAWLSATIKDAGTAELAGSRLSPAPAADAAGPAEVERAAAEAARAIELQMQDWLRDMIVEAAAEESQALAAREAPTTASMPAAPAEPAPAPAPSPEAPTAAERAAAAAGIPMRAWVGELFKDMNLRAPPAEAAAAGEARPRLPFRRAGVDELVPGRYQMRARFDADLIVALADSIKTRGVLQPIIVRERHEDGAPYEIIAGERRWRASQEAGLAEVPVLVLEVSDREAMEIALVENLQREDLSPLEEAEGYRRIVEEMGETQDKLAAAIGKSRSHVSNMLRLLRLPESIKALLADGRLSAGHGRALLAAADPEGLAREIVEKGLSVRETESLAQAAPAAAQPGARRGGARDPDLEQIEDELSRLFGVGVRIALRGSGDRGMLRIRFKGLEQLHDLIERLRT